MIYYYQVSCQFPYLIYSPIAAGQLIKLFVSRSVANFNTRIIQSLEMLVDTYKRQFFTQLCSKPFNT